MARTTHRAFLRLAIAGAALAVTPSALACGSSGYTYAGLASASRGHGVSARVTALGAPGVKNGHVAGWIGVGGPKLGPRGTDEWLQVGFSGFQGSSESDLYYEVTRPGGAPTYHQIESRLPAGTVRRLAVLEMNGRPGWWRIWVDGRAVSAPISLPGSNGTWRGVATAESWGAGQVVCNNFAYRFDKIAVAKRPGGAWHSFGSALPIFSGGFKFTRPTLTSFLAVSGPILKPVLRPVASASPPATATPAAAATATPAPAPAPTATPAPTEPPADAPVVADAAPVDGP